MRVLFVFADLSSDKTNYTGSASYGIAMLSSALREARHEVSLYHLTSMPTEEVFREKIRSAGADLIAFSSNSHYARRLRKWTAWARSEGDAMIAVGGVHATLAPQDVSSNLDVHFTCIGEGDSVLPELCDTLEHGGDPSNIDNIWARLGASLTRHRVRPFLQNLDELPDPDLSLFDFNNLYSSRRGVFPYIMSRGCAYQCTYCSAPAYERLSPNGGRFWRFMTPERAATQLGELVGKYMPDAPLVTFLDSIFFPNKEWLHAFAPLYKEHVGRPFSCNLRADFVCPETTEILSGMGCFAVRLGVESGNERMTTQVLNRRLTIEDIRNAFGILRDHGIKRWSYNMVGLPGETLEMALETVRLNAELEPDLALSFMFYPYPGTKLHDLCAAQGRLTDREFDHYLVDVGTESSTFSRSDILFVHRFFAKLIRLYGLGEAWPAPARRLWRRGLDWALTSRLLPRGALVRIRDHYKRFRHSVGEYLVRRSPRLYHILGGTDPL